MIYKNNPNAKDKVNICIDINLNVVMYGKYTNKYYGTLGQISKN